ncbi:MAG: hypothetical protein KJP00_01200 [Bacteroidia bacterium]|nr:hypothetical protein [Bacteroidia bacterium]
MNIRIILVIGVLVSFVLSCTSDFAISSLDVQLHEAIKRNSPTQDLDYFIMPQSDDYASLPNQDPHNPITKEKVDLGQLLFFETGLAQDAFRAVCLETYSCSTCHIPSKGFLPGRMQGIADGAFGFGDQGSHRSVVAGYDETELDAQGNRPLTVMNVTYVTNTLWGGVFGANDRNIGTEHAWTGLAEVNHTGFAGLEAQNIEGFHLHRLAINDRVLYDFGYSELFDNAFPDVAEVERYTPETASFAMGSFLRTILTNDAPFQDYLSGDETAITESQKKGAVLFFGKAGCATCHNSPSFSAMNFYTLGTRDMYESGGLNTSADDPRIHGRGGFTGEENDMFKFKVPQLYNLKDYVTFFHGSSKMTIEEVIDFKLAAKSENPKVSDDQVALIPRSLTPEEKANLIDFLTNALHDPNMNRYLPDSVLSGYCFPNNDAQSKSDIGCN